MNTQQKHEPTLPDNYGFISNISALIDATDFELAPGHRLRRATDDEIAFIRKTLKGMQSGAEFYRNVWETTLEDGRGVLMPEGDWRYFVVAFRGTNSTLIELEETMALAPVELDVAFTVLMQWDEQRLGGYMWHPGRFFQISEDARWRGYDFVNVGHAEAQAVTEIHSRLRQHDENLLALRRLTRQLLDLKALPKQSPLRFLGYFALLESLLVHSPKPSDPYDSITRQVKKKLTLLDHRWKPPMDYQSFGGTPPETVWTKMYSYRSQLAHGGIPTFDGELAALGSHENALNLLKNAVKATIRQALIEPQLVLDLREC